MRSSVIRVLDSPYTVRAAMALTVALGYFFIFVWAPHPWSWQGIDAYHELARALARGESFPTTDVPWGYTYYAAFHYRLFGERIWVPLVVQATLNGLVPLLLYRLTVQLSSRRVAVLAALIAGAFSFNTIYASTQSSDTICTVLFLGGLLLFMRGVREQRLWLFVASGVLFGLVPQFRPNLVLLPGVMIALYLITQPRTFRTLARAAAFGALVLALQLPWIVRNYQLTGLFLPTSTHGGVQLWYGTLQVGPYLESRAHNPRTHYASPAFAYTSLSHRPLVISALGRDCVTGSNAPTRLIYWTDRDSQRRAVPVDAGATHPELSFTVPAQPNGTAVYYFFEQAVPSATGTTVLRSPANGDVHPFVAFVSDNHLGDIDRHDDVLDVFDLARVLRHIAWQEPLRAAARLDVTRDGRVDEADLHDIVEIMLGSMLTRFPGPAARVGVEDGGVTLFLPDGSWLRVPRDFGGKQTDVDVSLDGEMAPALLARSRPFGSFEPAARAAAAACTPASELRLNTPFYLAEPFMMQRYMALAMDNIGRDPWAFARASLYRMVRLFVVRGTGDLATAQQFSGSALVYAAGTALSILYLMVFLSGVVVAWRRYRGLLVMLIPIVYVPVTICFVLTNMRYTVTVQPLMFAFVATAVAAALRLDERDSAPT